MNNTATVGEQLELHRVDPQVGWAACGAAERIYAAVACQAGCWAASACALPTAKPPQVPVLVTTAGPQQGEGSLVQQALSSLESHG